MSLYIALTVALLNITSASMTSPASSGQCTGTTPCAGEPSKGTLLLQSGSSVVPGFQYEFPEIDLDDEPKQVSAALPEENPAFYFSVCLDILIILIVANGIQRYRNGDHLAPVKQQQRIPSKTKKACELATTSVAAFHASVRENDVERCAALLDGCTATSASLLLAKEDSWGCNALHLASNAGSVLLVTMFLERGAKVDVTDAWEQTPLHFACRSGSAPVCEFLLSQGAAIDAVDTDEHTPLHAAALLGHEAVCNLLLERGGSLSQATDADVPPMLSALLVQRMFQGLPAAA